MRGFLQVPCNQILYILSFNFLFNNNLLSIPKCKSSNWYGDVKSDEGDIIVDSSSERESSDGGVVVDVEAEGLHKLTRSSN